MVDMADKPRSARMSFSELLVDESPDALIALSLEGRIRSWNRGAAAIFGYTVDEAVGSTIEELIVPDDRRAEARAALDEAIHKGSILIDTVRRRKDGTPIHLNVSTATCSSATNVRRPRRTPGEGSIFSAILPRTMTLAPADHLVPVMGPRAGSRTILVVDDDAAALKLADAAVRELGYKTV